MAHGLPTQAGAPHGQFRVPGYLPFAQPASNRGLRVPNQAFGFWPQGQLAPAYFPPGHASFQPFVYPTKQRQYDLNGVLQVAKRNPSVTFSTGDVLTFAAGVALGVYAVRQGWLNRLLR